MGYKVNLAAVPETAISSGRWQPLNERLGIAHFGISAVVMDPGDDFDIEHDEADYGHQEAYIVVAGRASFRIGGQELRPGREKWSLCRIRARRGTTGRSSPGTRIVCLGAGPGAEEPYGRWIADAAG